MRNTLTGVFLLAFNIFPSAVNAGAEPAGAAPPGAAAAHSDALSLDKAVEIALKSNPSLRASRGEVRAASGRALQATAWPNPELELSAEDVPLESSAADQSKALVGLAQTVPFPGKKTLDGEIGRWNLNDLDARLQLARRTLVRNVKVGFMRVLAAQGLSAIIEDLVKVAERSSGATRKRVEAGDVPLQEGLRAQVQLEQAKAARTSRERELLQAHQELALLLGDPKLRDAAVTGTLSETPHKGLLLLAPEQWLATHPAMQSAQAFRGRAGAELKRAKLEPYPDVKLGLAGGRDWASDGSVVEMRLSIPLPVLDRSRGRIQEAQANSRVSTSQLEAVRQTLLSEWGEASSRFRTLISETAAYRDRILAQSDQAVRLVQDDYAQGKFSLTDLLDTQRTAAEVRVTYQEKLLELGTAQADLEALAGDQPGGMTSAAGTTGK
jgi:outer membrane protein, heavy metal efflux system